MLAREFVAAVRPTHARVGCPRAPALAEPDRDGAGKLMARRQRLG
jgi:hypothetical protein